jgi:hypothetical protein
MRNVRNNVMLLLLFIFAVSCVGMTDNEEKAIEILANRYPDYKFSKHSDLSEAYLKVRLTQPNIDSVELKSVYSGLLQIKRDTLENGQPFVSWMYLVIYNNEGEYLFTIVKNGNDVLFFEDDVR